MTPFRVSKALAADVSSSPAVAIEPTETKTLPNRELGLIAVLVEKDLLKDSELKELIMTFAQNAQNRIPHSQAFLMGIEKGEDTFKIATVLEKMYYEGMDLDLLDDNAFNDRSPSRDANQLQGIILIGDVPLPIVHPASGAPFPSLYPYTDFYRKRYIYNHETNYFEEQDGLGTVFPEVWHGVINPSSKNKNEGIAQIKSFLEKNKKYSEGRDGYDEFDELLFYSNFPAMEERLNFMEYNNYKRYITYLEEMAFGRYNHYLLKQVIHQFSAEQQQGVPEDEIVPLVDDETLYTLNYFTLKKMFQQYVTPLSKVAKIYLGRLNEIIPKTGRYTTSDLHTVLALVAGRDGFGTADLKAWQMRLEEEADRLIDSTLQPANDIQLTSYAKLKVHSNIPVAMGGGTENRRFDFNAYIDGKAISQMQSTAECRRFKGQKNALQEATEDELLDNPNLVAENNSVYVEANRLYALRSLIIPPEDDNNFKLKEDEDYLKYGGCVYNNAYLIPANPDEGIDDELGPHLCSPQSATRPVYDVLGSFEADPRMPEYFEEDRCSWEATSFLPALDKWNDTAATDNLGLITRDLESVINKSYNILAQQVPPLVEPANDLYTRGSQVVKYLLSAPDAKVDYKIGNVLGDIKVTLSIEDQEKEPLSTIVKHKEPTKATMDLLTQDISLRGSDGKVAGSVQANKLISTIPQDGIHFAEFKNNGQYHHYEYFNLFRVQGENIDDIAKNLVTGFESKMNELESATGRNANSVWRTFLENIEAGGRFAGDWNPLTPDQRLSVWQGFSLNEKVAFVQTSPTIEPILWRTLGVDQKFKNAILKYLDRDRVMSVRGLANDNAFKTGPNDGYQIFHIRAYGDSTGYEFGLNKAMLAQSGVLNLDAFAARDQGDGAGASAGQNDDNNRFKCGDPSKGVEIWEWWDALQCWINEEIIPLGESFSLDGSCGAIAEAPPEEEEEEDILDENLYTPNSLVTHIERTAFVKDEEGLLTIKPLNNEGNEIMGYIDTPIQLEWDGSAVADLYWDDPQYGQVKWGNEPDEGLRDSFHIFTGSGQVRLKAIKPGSSTLILRMGETEKRIPIRVYDSIHVDYSHECGVESGLQTCSIMVQLRDKNNQLIDGVDAILPVKADRELDGVFLNDGKIQLRDGNGSIKFIPRSGVPEVQISTPYAYYTSNPYIFYPPSNPPVQLVIQSPKYLPVGKKVNIPVIAADQFGSLADFDKTVTLSLSDETRQYAQLLSPRVDMIDGRGTIVLQSNKQTAFAVLTAEHEDLISGHAEIPILERMESEDIESIYPENLFASLVGFPAGNILEDNYFGGAHLFSGKTEAVFSSMAADKPEPLITVHPNYAVEVHDTAYEPHFSLSSSGQKLNLQVFNTETRRVILTKEIPLQFTSVELWEGGKTIEPGHLYVEKTDDSTAGILSKNKWELQDSDGIPIVTVTPDRIRTLNPSYYRLTANTEIDPTHIELSLGDGIDSVARFIMSFPDQDMLVDDFEVPDNLVIENILSGSSTHDRKGVIVYDPLAETPEMDEEEYYGFEGEDKYLQLISGGTPFGEAVAAHLPPDGILLGDPTISLSKLGRHSSLDYDKSRGRMIYQDPKGSKIASITSLDFNHDDQEDIAFILKDGRIRLMEAGATDPIYKDRGDIAYLADGVTALESFDFKQDGYDDLLVATQEGRLAILDNDREVITRYDQPIKVGKKLYTAIKADIDGDLLPDLITTDSRGDILVFYNKGDVGQLPFPETGKLVDNFGFSITDRDLGNNLKVHFPGLEAPAIPLPSGGGTFTRPSAGEPVITPSAQQNAAMQAILDGDYPNVSDEESQAFHDMLEKAAQAFAEDPEGGIDDLPTSKPEGMLPWPSDNETETKIDDDKESYFEVANKVKRNGQSFLTVKKTLKNLTREGGKNVDLEEQLEYTVTITSSQNVNNVVFADQTMDALTFDSATCEGRGCEAMQVTEQAPLLYFHEINLKAGETITIHYVMNVKFTPQIMLDVVYPENYQPGMPLSLIVSPPYNSSGIFFRYLPNQDQPRTFIKRTTEDEDYGMTEDKKKLISVLDKHTEKMSRLEALMNKDELSDADLEFLKNLGKEGEAAIAAEDEGDSGSCWTTDTDATIGCANQVLDNIIGAINDFACMASGCFPMPVNQTFLAPQTMPLPLVSFPATMITPIGPMPAADMFNAINPLGSSSIAGPIMSQIRLYYSVTMTGGMAFTMCWGPYMGNSTPPPAVFPIPYPPPIGNCIPIALPMGEAWPCKKLEDMFNWIVEQINAGIGAINDFAANTLSAGPVQAGPASQGDDDNVGLEISLGANLGADGKFTPPKSGFTNVHVPPHDSLMGIFSDWLDRQMNEFDTKILTLPTFFIVLPDFASKFSADTTRLKLVWNKFKAKTEGTFDKEKNPDLFKIQGDSPKEEGLETSQFDKSNIDEGVLGDAITFPVQAAAKGLDYAKIGTDAISNSFQFAATSVNVVEDFFEVLHAVPFVNFKEQPIEIKVPWVSPAEVTQYINEMNQWVVHHQREIDRVSKEWDEFACVSDTVDAPEGEKGDEWAECFFGQIAEMFMVNFGTVLNSVQKNIEVLNEYKSFPKKLLAYKKQLLSYLEGIACIMDVITEMFGGWLLKTREQVIQWATLVIILMELYKVIKELIDIFVNFDMTCSICTNERFANFGWWMLLGLILPPIPIIVMPKWPDLMLDLSDLNAEINITIPVPHVTLEPIPLPPLPYLYLPKLPTLDLLFQLPPLPILPAPPELPPPS